jgi:ubiquinone biosynthesis monooxygenase Coq7
LSFSDRILDELQHGLNTSHVRPAAGARGYPANEIADGELDERQIAHIAGLMRVNNAGEVAAQGLYRGQALGARAEALGASMQQAAQEENEHLHWCQRRLAELNRRRSLLDGVWYWGSFTIGALAGAAGDKWSLGFVKETEQQVCAHLDRHLEKLPPEDERSRAIIGSMREDEARHAESAANAGAAELPAPVKAAMTLVSKVMTFTAYRI